MGTLVQSGVSDPKPSNSGNIGGASGFHIRVAFSSDTVIGNIIVVYGALNGSATSDISGGSDSAGNTYTLQTATHLTNSTGLNTAILTSVTTAVLPSGFCGKVSASTTTTATCTDLAGNSPGWTTNQWAGKSFQEYSTGSPVTVASNTANVLTFSSSITAPTVGNPFSVGGYVKISYSGTNNYAGGKLQEWSGVSSVVGANGTQGSFGAAATITSPAVTLSSGTGVAVGFCTNDGTTGTTPWDPLAGAGFTDDGQCFEWDEGANTTGSAGGTRIEHKAVSAGSITAVWTTRNADHFQAAHVVLQDATTVAPLNPIDTNSSVSRRGNYVDFAPPNLLADKLLTLPPPFIQREDLGRVQYKGVYSDFQPSNFPLRIPAPPPLKPLEMGVTLRARGIYTDFVPLNFPTRIVPPPPVKSVDLGSAVSLRGVFSDFVPLNLPPPTVPSKPFQSTETGLPLRARGVFDDFVPANIVIQVSGPGPFIAVDVSGISPRPGLIDFAVPNFLAKAAAVTPLVPTDATVSIRARGTFTDFSPPNLSLSTLASPLAPLYPQDSFLRLEYRWIRGDDLPINRRPLTQAAVTPLAPQDLSGMRVEAKAVRSDFAPPNLTLFLPIPPPPPVSSPAGRHGTRAQARKRRERDVLRAQIEAFKERRKEAEANLIAMEDREVKARAKVLKRVKVKSADLTRGPTKPLEQYAPVKRAIAQRNDALAIYRDILNHLARAQNEAQQLREQEDEESAVALMHYLMWEEFRE